MAQAPRFSDTAKRPQNAQGFTLVELAISLIVIGLLLGGILKGQEIIGNARVANAVRHINDYETAAMAFRDTYDALPGDMPNPADRLRNCDTTTHCYRSGNDNGIIRAWDTTPNGVETFNFFVHLSRAGLVEDFIGGTLNTTVITANQDELAKYFPRLFKHFITVQTYPETATISSATATYFKWPGLSWTGKTLPAHVMRLIDEKLDDGLPDKGNVFVEVASGGTCPVAVSGGARYYAKKGDSRNCLFYIKAGF